MITYSKEKQNKCRRHSDENVEKLSLAFSLPSNPHGSTPPRRWLVVMAVTNYQQINKIPPSHHSGKEENDWKLYVGWKDGNTDFEKLHLERNIDYA